MEERRGKKEGALVTGSRGGAIEAYSKNKQLKKVCLNYFIIVFPIYLSVLAKGMVGGGEKYGGILKPFFNSYIAKI